MMMISVCVKENPVKVLPPNQRESGWEKLKGNGNEIQLETGVGGRGGTVGGGERTGRILKEIFDVHPAQIKEKYV